MAAVERELIVPETGLAMLFAPPFDHAPVDPGYIKGYPPGVRENGGQYTHAALWSVIAFTMLGEGDKAAGVLSISTRSIAATGASHRYKLEPMSLLPVLPTTASDAVAGALHRRRRVDVSAGVE